MKKVMLVAVMSLGTMAAFAQEEVQEVTTETTTVEAVAPEADQATEAVATEATEAVMASEEATVEAVEATEEAVEATEIAAEAAVAQDSYVEVAIEEVPAAITDALAQDYPEAKVSKALKNDMEQYKLEVVAQDGSELVLFADSEGNWIEM